MKAFVDGRSSTPRSGRRPQERGSPFDAVDASAARQASVRRRLGRSAEDDGIRVHGASKRRASLGGADFASKLLGRRARRRARLARRPRIGHGSTSSRSSRRTRSSPQALQQLRGVARRLLDDVLDAAPQRDRALRRGPARRIPEVTLVARADGRGKALATLDSDRRQLGDDSRGQVESGTSGAGTSARRSTSAQFAIHYGASGDKIVITSGVNGIADCGGPGEHAADSADFKEAKDAAGMPDTTGGFVFIDLKNLVPLIQGFARPGRAESCPATRSTTCARCARSSPGRTGQGDDAKLRRVSRDQVACARRGTT